MEGFNARGEKGGRCADTVNLVFHLAHCAADCAAPQLWSKLK